MKQSKPKRVRKSNITELTLDQGLAMTAANYHKMNLNLQQLTAVNLEQEARQTKIVEYKKKITVNIAREDFPDIHAYIDVWYVHMLFPSLCLSFSFVFICHELANFWIFLFNLVHLFLSSSVTAAVLKF